MCILKDLFDESEVEAITVMAADADLRADEWVRRLVLEALQAHLVNSIVQEEETILEVGEEPTLELDEVQDRLE